MKYRLILDATTPHSESNSNAWFGRPFDPAQDKPFDPAQDKFTTGGSTGCPLARDRHIPVCGKISASDGDLAIPYEQIADGSFLPSCTSEASPQTDE